MTPEREQDLRTLHAAAATQREMATVESEVWMEHRRDARDRAEDPGNPAPAIARFLNVPLYVVDARRRLLLAGDLADPLWGLLEGDLTLATAVRLLRCAQTRRVPPERLSQSLRRAIAEYYALPEQRRLDNGKVSRRGPQRPRGQAKKDRPQPDKPREVKKPEEPAGGDFWKHLRSMCSEYARSRLPDHSDEQVDADLRILEADLKVVFEQFTDRVRNKLRDTPLTVVVARRQLTEACRVLLLDPPKDRQKPPPAFFEKAKRQFKVLAREYHPDTSTGGEATRPQFESVMNAWNVLQQFQHQLQTANTSSKGDSP